MATRIRPASRRHPVPPVYQEKAERLRQKQLMIGGFSSAVAVFARRAVS
jgi:hypothetical protein